MEAIKYSGYMPNIISLNYLHYQQNINVSRVHSWPRMILSIFVAFHGPSMSEI